MSTKAQTATEYMIILAVVIIIALIVVGVMDGIPGIGTGARSRASASYWSTAKIAVTSYSVVASATDPAKLKIRNNLRDAITIEYVNMSISGSNVATKNLTQTNVTLGVGAEKEFTGPVTGLCNAAGDAWTSNIWIKYTDDETGAVYTFTGQGNKLEGVCAQS